MTSKTDLPSWPTEPQRANAGRYGNVLWTYAEYVGEYDYVGRKYEKDRADAALARLRLATKALHDIGHGPVQEDESIAHAAAALLEIGDLPNE